jgi:hypothetical protein
MVTLKMPTALLATAARLPMALVTLVMLVLLQQAAASLKCWCMRAGCCRA